MEFFRFTAGRLNKKTLEFTQDKLTEVVTHEHVFCDMLQEIFTKEEHIYLSFIPEKDFNDAVKKRYYYYNLFQNKNVKIAFENLRVHKYLKWDKDKNMFCVIY